MATNQNRGQGWYGDSEGHAEAARESHKENGLNWLPFLLIPLAFFVGTMLNNPMDNRTNNGQAYDNSRIQTGQGGGGVTPCTTPGVTAQ